MSHEMRDRFSEKIRVQDLQLIVIAIEEGEVHFRIKKALVF